MIDAKVEIDLSPMKDLRRSLVSKILRKAITQASRIVRDRVKDNAQEVKRLGYLAKSIGIRVKVYDRVAVAIVGPRSKWKRENGVYTRGKKRGEPRVIRPSYYLHLVERGTSHSKAKPVLAPALSSTESQFLETLRSLIEQGIADQLAKQQSKG